MEIQGFIFSGVTTIDGVVFGEDGATLILYEPETQASYVIPEGVVNIAPDAFRGHEELTSIVFPDSIKRIGEDAFRDCTGLVSVSLPNGIEQIDCGAFEDCTCLTSITIPDSVKYIGYDTFDGCYALRGLDYRGKTYNTISFLNRFGHETRGFSKDFYDSVNAGNKEYKTD